MGSRLTNSANTLELYPLISYNIIAYLVDNNEMIWKLLKHTGADAWNQTDLTSAEKRALVYAGQSNIKDYRVFLDGGQDSSWTQEACFLRVPVLAVYPANRILANVIVGFEVYCHSKISHLSNYQTRADTIVHELVSTLNEQEIGGIGRIYFEEGSSSPCKIIQIGKVPFMGKGLMMANWVV
jgi:hypothetical protein